MPRPGGVLPWASQPPVGVGCAHRDIGWVLTTGCGISGRRSAWRRAPASPGVAVRQVDAEHPVAFVDLGSAWWVALSAEPLVLVAPLGRDRLTSVPGGGGHGVDLVGADRLPLHPDLMALPGLSLGHHLGHQVPAQPHLPGLSPTGPCARPRRTRGLVHERCAHPLTNRTRILPSGPGR